MKGQDKNIAALERLKDIPHHSRILQIDIPGVSLFYIELSAMHHYYIMVERKDKQEG